MLKWGSVSVTKTLVFVWEISKTLKTWQPSRREKGLRFQIFWKINEIFLDE